jgi:tetratricopeptide (TPR) repeat protein
MTVNCPHCRQPIDLTDARGKETACPACGGTISLASFPTISLAPIGEPPHTTKPRTEDSADPAPPMDRAADTYVYDGHADGAVAEGQPVRQQRAMRPVGAPPSPPKVLRYFGDYELLDEIARGGMGVVYRARQKSLNRVVAVKMILGGQLASAAEVQRFLTEAEAAANLHHPNIVAIHEVGEHESLHYFSMDFVAGKSLAALVLQNPLPPRRAAGYVQKIAEAVQYAHQHGILHRDLKPSNVLVDETDQPRITDFGLAKRLEHESGLTASGAVLGTPSYMPPEQAEGRHQRVSPASDVYSTGAILYELVTGRPPFRAESPIETLRQVLDAEPAPPSLLNPKVDRDIETICLKCLQKDAARRYVTAQALAEDLGRYLRGEPIHARPVSVGERLVRWCRRNPRMAGMAAAVLFLLVTVAVGSTSAAIRINREKAETEAARQRAHENYLTAEEQRTRAEENFQKAREAVNQMLTRVADDVLLELPQTEPVRRALLQDALVFYQGFLREKATDPVVQQETGKAYFRVGEILRMLGDDAESKTSYTQAIGLFADLVGRFPERSEYARDLARTHNFLGELHRTVGQLDEAEREYRRAIDLQQPLADDAAADPADRSVLARALYNLGIVLKNTGRSDDADTAYERAVAILEDLCERHHSEAKYRLELAQCLVNRGILFKDTQRLTEAEAAYGHAIRILTELIGEHPARLEYRLALAACSNNMGNLLLRDPKRFDDATTNFQRALELYEKLASDFPSMPSHRKELANSCNSLAALLLRKGQATEARVRWGRGREIAELLVQEYPDVPDYHQILGGIQGNLGASMTDADDAPRARDLLEDAVRHERTALDSNPQHPVYRQFLRTDYVRLARVASRQGDYARAAETARLAAELGFESSFECQRAAVVFAECVTRVGRDDGLSDDRKKDLSESYAAQAMTLLRQAIDKGYRNVESLRRDLGLESLRPRSDFQALLDELEAKIQSEADSKPR